GSLSIDAGDGNDVVTIDGNQSPVTVTGGAGNDLILVGETPGPVTIDGGSSNDTLMGGNGNNEWILTEDNAGTLNGNVVFLAVENLNGGDGSDSFLLGNDRGVSGEINGGSGSNTLSYAAYTRADTADLRRETATRVGRVRNIRQVIGGAGDDLLRAGTGSTVLRGGNGNDIVVGSSAGDQLFGDNGRDLLIGGEGSDLIEGGADED